SWLPLEVERTLWHCGSVTLINVSAKMLHVAAQQTPVRPIDRTKSAWKELFTRRDALGDDDRGTGKAARAGPHGRGREAHRGAAFERPADRPRAFERAARSGKLRRI